MSESSSNNSIKNIPKKNVTYSTDYMVDYLKASEKLVSSDNRKVFQKNLENNISDNSDSSDNLDSYVNKEKITSEKNISDTPKKLLDSDNNKSSNFSNNLFEKSINVSKNNDYENYKNNENKDEYKYETKDENKKNITGDEEYDNYNELAPEAQMLKKLEMLRKLGELAQYGVKLSQNYNMNSDYFTMKYEFQLHTNIRAKQNFINWTSSIMLNCIYGVEILNEKYDPFSLKLTKWSEQINADISSYYDIFGEIYEKYNKPGKSMSPELKLILMIGGSALKFHLNNVASSSKISSPQMFGLGGIMPNFNMGNQMPNINQQDPALLEKMRQQAHIESIIDQQKKQNELLNKKSENEHTLAAQQMQDMLFLQQKQNELIQQEQIRKKQIEEFEKTKMMLEKKNNPSTNINVNTNVNKNVNTNQINELNELRKNQINNQLNQMKKNMSKIIISDKDSESNVLYNKPATNVKIRNNIKVDTSSESSDKSKKSETSEKSSENSTNSEKVDSSENTKSKNNSKISLNSRNNQSTYSKRKYKRNTLVVDTA